MRCEERLLPSASTRASIKQHLIEGTMSIATVAIERAFSEFQTFLEQKKSSGYAFCGKPDYRPASAERKNWLCVISNCRQYIVNILIFIIYRLYF
jgi:hypothetical protein